jgi:deoxyribodipyrimidine photolyase
VSEAARRAESVVPVFILEDALRTGPDVGASRLAFLILSVDSLRKNLEELGYPIVDAAMRCLNATGWMHNHLRMIVAMFLTRDLLISWQRCRMIGFMSGGKCRARRR